MNEKSILTAFNKNVFCGHLLLTFLVMAICWGSYLASSITTAVIILVALILIFVFREKNIGRERLHYYK
jgi:hypothetical protein